MLRILLFILLAAPVALAAPAQPSPADFVPEPGKFPPPGVGVYLAGELVSVDHVNRRGALRLMGDGVDERYHMAPSHKFALLPYATIRYRGAPAELRDVPIGTLLHGYFTLPPAGDTTFGPPTKNRPRYTDPHTFALSLEDDVSFYGRQNRAWKIAALDKTKNAIKLTHTGDGPDGLKGEQAFEFYDSTRVWKGRGIADVPDLAVGQEIFANFTWAPDWKNGQLSLLDVWLDKDALAVATEQQRRTHVRHQRTRWLAGFVDHVEHTDPPGSGIVTITLFGGHDPTLYAPFREKKTGAAIAAAEPTLRTWWQEHDHKYGPLLDAKEIPNAPAPHTGLQIRVQIKELLEGYRPGRVVRVRPNNFPNVKLPPEERVQNMDDR